MRLTGATLLKTLILASMFACGKGGPVGQGSTSKIPLVTPPVRASAPRGLGGSSTPSLIHVQHGEGTLNTPPSGLNSLLSASDFKSRFFSGNGPTDILGSLLPSLDGLITGINGQLSSNSPCLTQSAVEYSIAPFGQTVIMYAQCYNQMSPSYPGDPALVQFGVADGGTYIYAANGAEWEAAIVTPIADGGSYSVQAWIGLGYSNTRGCSTTWDGCSYAGMQLTANPSTHVFELAVAGMGIGYCGAQLRSDGTNLWAQGSGDMGTNCGAVDTLCVAANDATTPGTCTAPLTTFDLPPMGRVATASTAPVVVGEWGASTYPASPNTLFNGTATDSIHFGPTVPTPGVGNLQAGGTPDAGP